MIDIKTIIPLLNFLLTRMKVYSKIKFFMHNHNYYDKEKYITFWILTIESVFISHYQKYVMMMI